jgi:transposase
MRIEPEDWLDRRVDARTRALEEEVEKRPVTRRLMMHRGVGPLTALAFELVIGTPERQNKRWHAR